MPNVLIRGLSEAAVAHIDADAAAHGLSRNEYLRRQLAGEVQTRRGSVTVEDLRRSANVFADIENPDVMADAWS